MDSADVANELDFDVNSGRPVCSRVETLQRSKFDFPVLEALVEVTVSELPCSLAS